MIDLVAMEVVDLHGHLDHCVLCENGTRQWQHVIRPCAAIADSNRVTQIGERKLTVGIKEIFDIVV